MIWISLCLLALCVQTVQVQAAVPLDGGDGKYIAFQMAKLGDPASVGRGLFLLDIKAKEAVRKKQSTKH